MRKVAATLAALGLAGCAVFGGLRGADPLAGWGGVWTGEYQGGSGAGPLEFEFSTDTAGMPVGVARFDTGMGMEQTSLGSPVLTRDSVRCELSFDGMAVEIRGARSEEDSAEGVFVVRYQGGEQPIDSGIWTAGRRPAGQ
ncbi:MAG: hypothetical protein JSV41_00095 [Gemmatimonadota bacterium]|nr:MAG: hypothetical protein JSV41_00095 [Gemmatimonadota bacterium]